MKKHNEGYTLVLVLMVMVILSLLSASILTAAMQNLKFQETSAQRMSDTYAVEGELEKVTARLETALNSGTAEVVLWDADETGTLIQSYGNNVSITIRRGQTELDCVLTLLGINGPTTITDLGDGVYRFTDLAQIEYAHYEISTVEEVAADNALEDYKERPTDAEYTPGE